MCGIAGILYREKRPDPQELSQNIESMANSLVHRGPDAGDHWIDPEAGIALGHRRLSILDLSAAGAQPMRSANGRFVISYNGEIYNFASIREQLVQASCQFRGHSDTEVLLAAIEEWGVDRALESIHGMFAFAVWDCQQRELTLARDRVGKKPLYYGWCNGVFMFASELKALRQIEAFDAVIDTSALTNLIEFGWISEPLSIFKRIRKLQPGTSIRIKADADPWDPPVLPYWQSGHVMESAREQVFNGSIDGATDHLDTLLTQAVEERMVADVDIGAFLSGGVDSSTIVGIMQHLSERPVKTFSIGFQEKRYNEAEYAADVANYLGTDHHEMIFGPQDCLNLIDRMPDVYDEPFADASQLPTYLVAQVAAGQVKVVLSGDGGDELFAGYKHYRESAQLWLRIKQLPLPARRSLVQGLRWLEKVAWQSSGIRRCAAVQGGIEKKSRFSTLSHKSREWEARSIQEVLAKHFSKAVRPSAYVLGESDRLTNMQNAALQASGVGSTAALRQFDYVGYLPGDLLVKLDRATMANSIEARCPILDDRITRFAWSLPDECLFDSSGGKRVLKRVLKRYVPRKLTDRPKRGFGVPVGDWMRHGLRDWSEDLLSADSLGASGCLNTEAIRLLWRQHVCGWKDNSKMLWSVLMFQAWWYANVN